MTHWKKKFLSSLTILGFLMSAGAANAKNVDCVHCGKTRIEVNFDGTNVNVVNTSIQQITDMISSTRGAGHVLSDRDNDYICTLISNPSKRKEENLKLLSMAIDRMKKNYKIQEFMQVYPSIQCIGGMTLLQTCILFGNLDVARELYKMHVPLNLVNEYGETELDFYLRIARAAKKKGITDLSNLAFFTRVFRGNKGKSYDVPLLTCEIEGKCKCPFALPNFGAECTPPQF